MSHWTATVVDNNDPERIGRVKIRIHGFHTELISDEDLPWVLVLQPIYSAALQGYGITPLGLLIGSFVIGVWMDPGTKQVPLILGSLASKTEDVSDMNVLAFEAASSEEQKAPSNRNPQYPHNKVFLTEAGHIIEIDDSPGATRLHFRHKSGTYTEIIEDGQRSTKVVGDDFVLIQQNSDVEIQGNLQVTVKGIADITVDDQASITVEGPTKVTVNDSLDIVANKISITELGGPTGELKNQPQTEFPSESDLIYGAIKLINSYGWLALHDDAIVEGDSIPDTPNGVQQTTIKANAVQEKQCWVENGRLIISTADRNLTRGTNSSDRIIPAGTTRLSGRNDPLYATKLSKNFTLGDLTINTKYTNYELVSANDLDINQIAINLRNLAVNVLEPIRAKHPGFQINSGFRPRQGKSQHGKGEAADLVWTGKKPSEVFEIAKWIALNTPFDQMILEHFRTLVVHVSYSSARSRRKLNTQPPGLAEYPAGLCLHYKD